MAVPVAQVSVSVAKELSEKQRDLYNDYSILSNAFPNTDPDVNQAFDDAGMKDQLNNFLDVERKSFKLIKRLEGQEDVSDEDNFAFKALGDDFDHNLAALTALRVKLEGMKAGSKGYFEYQANVKYRVIGNQFVPVGVAMSKKAKKSKKRAHPDDDYKPGRQFE